MPAPTEPSSAPSNGTSSNGEGAMVPWAGYATPAVPAWSSMPPMRPEILSARPDPLGLMKALKKNWLLGLILAGFTGAACLVLAWFMVPQNWEVQSLIKVAWSEPDANMERPRPVDPKAAEKFRLNQPVMVKNPLVLRTARSKPGISQLPMIRDEVDQILWLQENLLVNYYQDSEVMYIRMRDDYPDQMVKIVNAVTDAYIDKVVDQENIKKRVERENLQSRLNNLNQDIGINKEQMNRIAAQIGTSIDDAAKSKEALITMQLSSLEANKNRISAELRKLRSDVSALNFQKQSYEDPEKMDMYLEEIMQEDRTVARMMMDISQLEAFMSEQSQVTRRETGHMLGMKRQLQALYEKVQQYKSTNKPMLMKRFQMLYVDSVDMQLKMLDEQQNILEQDLAQAVQNSEEKAEELSKVRKFDKDLAQLQLELVSQEQLAAQLATKIGILDVELGMEDRIQRLEQATIPDGNPNFTRYVLIAFCGVSGFGLALVGFAFAEFTRRRVDCCAEMSEGLGLPVMGAIPELNARVRRQLAADANHPVGQMLAESIDTVRAMLMHSDRGKSMRVIMVTSAVEQEGKSTVASQLAASLARCGRKTLLVDSDLRNPSAHLLFGLDAEPGLADYLRGEAEVADICHAIEGEGLALLPAGRGDWQSVQALTSNAAHELFDALRSEYEFVIVDSSPVLSLADSLLIGQFVDAAILAVLRQHSQIPRVYEAYEKLNSVGIEVLGTVVGGENRRGRRARNQLQAQGS